MLIAVSPGDPEIGVMIMNLYECLEVEVSSNATAAGGEWTYMADGFPAVICEQVGARWGG